MFIASCSKKMKKNIGFNEQVTDLKQTKRDTSYHLWLKLGNISLQNKFSGVNVHDFRKCLDIYTVEKSIKSYYIQVLSLA